MLVTQLKKLYKKLLDKSDRLRYAKVTVQFEAGKIVSLKIEESVDMKEKDA